MGLFTHINPQNVWMTPIWYVIVGVAPASLWRARGSGRRVAALFVTAWLGTTGVLLLATGLPACGWCWPRAHDLLKRRSRPHATR